MKIAVDAMGGDYAPEAIVEGAVQAAEEYGSSIILVGQKDLVDKELEKYETTHLDIEVRHASQVVDMHDEPTFALRRKRDSSLHVAINLTRDGEADAAISAGNTGAGMAIGLVLCRTLEGVDRPALATVMPNINGTTVVIDVGANVDCKPMHLLQFAVMGHVYAKELLKIESPRIGLLSIGEEDTKGNVLTKEVFEPLSKSNLNFIGNAEGRDVFNGRVDVVVCDGFTGNVVLKVSESLAKTIGSLLREGFAKNWRTKLGYLLVKPAITHLKKRTDYTEYGGAPLLGLNKVVIISHGSSKARAIKNAIRVAGESVELQIQEKIAATMEKYEFDVKSRKRATSFWRRFRSSTRHESDKEKPSPKKQEEIEQEEQLLEAEQPLEPEQQQEPVQEQEQEHLQELEHEKRAWWHLKDSKHRDKSKAEKLEATEQNEQIQEPEPEPEPEPPSEPEPQQESTQEQEKLLEPEYEKRRWWRFRNSRHRDANKLDHHKEAETQESIQEPEQSSESDQQHESVIEPEEQQKSEE
jgi:glycerol-3-phosphate acyltransferase PlsX